MSDPISSLRGRGVSLPKLAIKRPITVLMAFLAMLVLGTISYLNVPLELLPSGFTPPYLYVNVPSLPSSPADVEERVALPVEEMLSTIRGIQSLRTTANVTSAGFLMEFADGTDMDLAYNQVQDRMERVIPTLDETAQQYGIWKWDPADDPIIWIGLTSEQEEGIDPLFVRSSIVPFVERVAGVSNVEVMGGPDPVVVIELNDRMVRAAGTTTYELTTRLMSDNFVLSGGELNNNEQRFPIRILAQFENLQQLQALPIGNGLLLDDIASIYIEDRAEEAVYRVNQRNGIFLGVYREALANSVDVSEKVQAAIEQAIEGHEEEITVHFFFDQGSIILDALNNLKNTALWGGLFAILVLSVFLRRISMTLLVASAIPMSLLLTLIIMFFMGTSLNVLSLTGLMLTVGMVVDNSIVVVESIQRRRTLGDTPKISAILGAGEVALAIVVATLTTVVVFLPIMLMSGSEMLSFFLRQIGLPVCVGLLSSLVVSLIFVPLATTFFANLKQKENSKKTIITKISEGYASLLAIMIRRRTDAVLLAMTMLFSISFPMSRVPISDQADTNINDIRIFLELPAELSWEERQAALLACEEAIWDSKDELYVEDLLTRMGGRWGWPQLRVFLVDPAERDVTREELLENAMEKLPELAGVSYFADWGDQSGSGTLSVQLIGPETERLISLSDEVARRLRTIDDVSSVRIEANAPSDEELHLHIEREIAARHGISSQMVGMTLDYALRGRRISDLHQTDQDIAMFVQSDTAQAQNVDRINNLEINGLNGTTTLGGLAHWENHQGFRSIRRQNRQTTLTLEIISGRDDLDNLSEEIDAALEGFLWPRGYGLQKGERFDVLDEGAKERKFALLLAVVFVFLLMGILLESFVLPFSVLLSIPFAFVGVYWALFLTKTPLDTMAFVGLIVLMGIVVNNAIVLVDLIAELRRTGFSRANAIIEAGKQRIRPILMTAATTIFGIIPMAIGTSSIVGIPYAPMGRAVIGGLFASTALTLFVVPLFYTFLDDITVYSALFMKILRKNRTKSFDLKK